MIPRKPASHVGGANLASAIIASVEGREWPADATHAVSYSMKAWPCGFDEARWKYFSSFEEFNEWLDDMKEWARCEDNEVQYTLYGWDLGPVEQYTDHLW